MNELQESTVEMLKKENRVKLDKSVGRGLCPGDEVAFDRVEKVFKDVSVVKE